MDQKMNPNDGSVEMSKPAGPRSPHEGVTSMDDLLDDVLYTIFTQCDIQTLGRLCRVCRRFNKLLQSDSAWLRHTGTITLIHLDEASRHLRKIKLKEQCRMSLNWAKKYFRERTLLRHKQKQLPWMQYSNQTLWISTNNTIKCYKVRGNGRVDENRGRSCVLDTKPVSRRTMMPDVSRFVVRDNVLVSGCRDGSLHVFDCGTGRNLMKFDNVHTSSTQAVDFQGSCIISGSTDKTVKVLSNVNCYDTNEVMHSSIDIGDRIWSVGMDPQGRSFAVGTAGCYGESSLSVWDIERNQMMCTLGGFRFGAGVLDMKFEDDHTLVTCGYDTCLRVWDMRCERCVLEWEEPFDTTLYCLQTDNDRSLVTGTARYGMVRLWDKRSRRPVQVYYLGPKNSPVYSVAFDSSRLYTALDMCIVMADFSILPS